jgi:tubulin polyglutamylase TTLL6/13
MHLTNYAINKEASSFIQNIHPDKTDVGHKRSLSAIFDHIDKNRKCPSDKTSEEVWEDIKQVCVKTIMSGIHQIAHNYKSSKPQDIENSHCFQILGMDVFLDENCKSWLIEVNQSPSFMADSPLDYQVKKNLLRDTFHMLNLSWKRKNKYINQVKTEMASRLVGKHRISLEEKE